MVSTLEWYIPMLWLALHIFHVCWLALHVLDVVLVSTSEAVLAIYGKVSSKQTSKQASKQANKQASKQARRQISLLISHGGASLTF